MNTMQNINGATTIGQIVAANFRSAEVFKKYGIDFCCKGGRPLEQVCREKQLDQSQVESEIREKTKQSVPLPQDAFQTMSLDALATHIEDRHHSYVRESIPVLLAYLSKINKVHGMRHPELNELFMLFVSCAEELTGHMVKEETILFPAIKGMARASERGGKISPFFFGALIRPISEMEREHAMEGARFSRIAELTNDFTPPEDACTTYRVSFMKLQEFMNDLHTHIHIENNILFPKAIELEGSIIA